jgi:hypothetical protein
MKIPDDEIRDYRSNYQQIRQCICTDCSEYVESGCKKLQALEMMHTAKFLRCEFLELFLQ